MTFKILPFGGARYARHYADHRDIRQYLGLRPDQKMPIDFCTTADVWVPLLDHSAASARLYCKPGIEAPAGERRWRNKSSAHRCYAVCPDCSADVPAGRTHQHKCKGGAA